MKYTLLEICFHLKWINVLVDMTIHSPIDFICVMMLCCDSSNWVGGNLAKFLFGDDIFVLVNKVICVI